MKGVDSADNKKEPKPEEKLKWLAFGGPEKPLAKQAWPFLIITFQNKSNRM